MNDTSPDNNSQLPSGEDASVSQISDPAGAGITSPIGEGHAMSQRAGPQEQGQPPVSGSSQSPTAFRDAPGAFQIRFQPPTPHQSQADGGQPRVYDVQDRFSTRPEYRGSAYNMSAMGNALPELHGQVPSQAHPQQIQPQRFPTAASTPALVYHLQQISQFAGQTAINSTTPMYNMPYSQQYPTVYQAGRPLGAASQMYPRIPQGQPIHAPGPVMVQPQYPQAPWVSTQQPPYYYYPTPYAVQGQPSQQQFQAAPYAAPSSRRSSLPVGQDFQQADQAFGQSSASFPPQSNLFGSTNTYGGTGPFLRPGSVPASSRGSSGSSSAQLSLPRGPPRKPKQSGHALWVGNLPPGANVVDLKDHFSRDATDDIESVFLISKSNCAFVNYRTEAACSAAMTRFHDSRFHGVRLVCRLRRNSSTSPSGAALPVSTSLSPNTSDQDQSPSPVTLSEEQEEPESAPKRTESGESEVAAASDPGKGEPEKLEEDTDEAAPRTKERFFIVKSLTVEDLEISVRNGIWATQSHNEVILNKAFETAENVYLIFSANKSGEYYGYARMASQIDDESVAAIRWAPAANVSPETDLPKAIPTPATETAPKGHIIDDLARGTIFWEADSKDDGEAQETETAAPTPETSTDQNDETQEGGSSLAPTSQPWGKAFRVEWLSTNRLPFYRTRGLRNPLNAHREVKIARDGTELEASVGRRLLQMFHRTGPNPGGQAVSASSSMMPPVPGMPMGYSPGRPF